MIRFPDWPYVQLKGLHALENRANASPLTKEHILKIFFWKYQPFSALGSTAVKYW